MTVPRTAVGVFPAGHRVADVVQALRREGFSDEDISVLAPGLDGTHPGGPGAPLHQGVEDGAAWGAGIGGTVGLLAAAGVLVLPGIGPLVAMGPLAATLTGATGGGLLGALTDLGVPAHRGRTYADRLAGGEFLVIVQAHTGIRRAARCLRDQGALDVHSA